MSQRFLKIKPYQKTDLIPVNIEECIKHIISWNSDNIEKFKQLTEEEAIATTYNTVGQWIRNKWGLWTGSVLKDYFIELGLKHPDDMSGLIIRCYHKDLNHKSFNIKEEVNKIKKQSI
jgi:hypothetical protein